MRGEDGMLTRRRDVRRYYRHLRAICTQHHTAIIPFISQAAFLEEAKRLRLITDGVSISNSTEALTLVYDLATYAAKPGRRRTFTVQHLMMGPLTVSCSGNRDGPQNGQSPAQGQADITSVNGPPSGSVLTSMKITAASGYGWTDFIFNPLNATPFTRHGTVTATVTVKDSADNVFSYDLGNGQNYLTMVEQSAHLAITEIDLMVAGGSFEEFKQPRVSGVCAITGPNTCDAVRTPEPAGLALLGVGLLGLGMIKYKRKSET
jgi:hypothetical protein